MKKFTAFLAIPILATLSGCDVKVSNPPAEKAETHTTIVNPPAEKKVENNTTIVNPPASDKK